MSTRKSTKSTSARPIYVVRRPFKYGGKELQKGDYWQPAGGRFDSLIAASRMVERVEAPAKHKEKANDGKTESSH